MIKTLVYTYEKRDLLKKFIYLYGNTNNNAKCIK